MSIKNRIGHFFISKELVENNHKVVQKVMGECVVIRCKMLYHKGYFDYYALSEHFDIVKEGCEPPFYQVIIDKDRNIIFQK